MWIQIGAHNFHPVMFTRTRTKLSSIRTTRIFKGLKDKDNTDKNQIFNGAKDKDYADKDLYAELQPRGTCRLQRKLYSNRQLDVGL